MFHNLLIKIKNLILDAIITRVIDSNTYQVSFLGKITELKSINPYGFKSIANNGSKLLIFAAKGKLDNAKALAINNADAIVEITNLVEGESVVYNENTNDYIIFKNDGTIKVKATTVNVIASDVNIAEGSKGVARLDDTVTGKIIIPSGSSAGTYNLTSGKIATASSKVVCG